MIRRAPHRSLLRTCALTLLALLLNVQAHGQSADDPELRNFFSANGMLNRGLFELAADEYRVFLDEHPDHAQAPTARYGLGVALFRLDRHDEAAAALESLDDAPNTAFAAEAAALLGQCRLALGDAGAAATCFERVLREHADSALADDAAALLAEARYLDGAYAAVAGPAETLAERFPDSPLLDRTALFAAMADMALARYDAAAVRLEALVARAPDGPYAEQATLLTAQSLHRSGGHERAVERYRATIARASDAFLPEALYGLSALLHERGDGPEAARLLDRVLDDHGDHALAGPALRLRGRIAFEAGRTDQARRDFERLATTAPALGDAAAYWLAKCDLRDDDPAGAARRLRDAIAATPKSALAAEMRYDRAVALSRADALDDAVTALDDFRERFPRHALAPDALHLAAGLRHRQEQWTACRRLCATFTDTYPGHALAPEVAFLAAESAFLAEDDTTAAEDYAAFLAAHGDHDLADRASYRLGMTQHRLGRDDDAESRLTRAAAAADDDETYRPAVLALGDLHFQRGDWDAAATALATYAGYGPDAPATDDALLKLGLCHHRRDRYDDAIARYDELLETHPDSRHRVQTVFERGQALAALDRDDDAGAAFRTVLDDAPESPFAVHALHHLGAIALAEERYGDAAARFEAVARRADDPALAAEALYRRGEALVAAAQWTGALRTLDTLLEDHPDSTWDASARAQRAVALSRLERHDDALAAIATIERSHADDLDRALRDAIRYEKAWCLRALAQSDDAADAYRALLDAEPDAKLARHARLELAELETAAGRHDEASALLAALVRGPQAAADDSTMRAQALYRLGASELERERFPAAAAALDAMIRAYPTHELIASASLLCGESLFRSGGHERAIPHFERVVTKHADDAASVSTALLRLGECRAALQRWEPSATAFRAWIERFEDGDLWFQARFGLGWAFENLGRHDDAMAEYGRVVARHRGATAARAQFQIGECLYAQRRYDEAARELLKVDILYAYPEWSAAALYEAGRCFEELGDPVAARDQFENVRRDHATTHWAKLAEERLVQLSTSGLPGQ